MASHETAPSSAAAAATLRQRKWPLNQEGQGSEDDNDSLEDRNRRHGSERIDRTFTTCILFSALAAGAVLTLAWLFPGLVLTFDGGWPFSSSGGGSLEYAVVLDAGSTGSRVLGFTFERSQESNALALKDELWKQTKPGLSSYADDPKAARQGLHELLEAAKDRVPEALRSETPITLKATAGLRLLPKSKSEAILAEVRAVLEDSGFKPEDNLIEIMNPLDEGLFGWFTVNFLLRQFEGENTLEASHVSLDLGGGSTQITFAPGQPVLGIEGRKHFKHNVTVMGRNVAVYSHSYLGLGLQAARQAVLALENPDLDLGGGVGTGPKVAVSSCMTTLTPKKWSFHGQEYLISHNQEGGASFQLCSQLVAQILTGVHRPEELKQRRIAAFSYFFDLAHEHGLIGVDRFDKELTVGDYKRMAVDLACGPKGTGFNCFDLTFIYQLLSQGYGLPDSKPLHVYKKIDGHEASWALGLAYNILQK